MTDSQIKEGFIHNSEIAFNASCVVKCTAIALKYMLGYINRNTKIKFELKK